MKIIRDIRATGVAVPSSVITLGNFDGIHLGHQALLRNAVADAHAGGIPSIAFTFDPHPLKVLAPQRAPQLLVTVEDKMKLFGAAGIDIVVLQSFDTAFAQLEARDFVGQFLVQSLKLKKLWAGRDLRFGRSRLGTVDSLTVWGRDWAFEVGIAEPVMIAGERVSSSRIRQLIGSGDVDQVQPMLGRYFHVSGKVVRGQRRGRELGFPTANIESRTEVLPLDGIYATMIEVNGESWPSASSIGLNPTFGEGPRTVEAFIFDFERDIYDQDVKLVFVKRIRGEQKFSSVDALIAQIRQDVAAAKEILNA